MAKIVIREFNAKSEKERLRRYRRYAYEAGTIDRPDKLPARVIDEKVVERPIHYLPFVILAAKLALCNSALINTRILLSSENKEPAPSCPFFLLTHKHRFDILVDKKPCIIVRS
jgi:hypothetical protein